MAQVHVTELTHTKSDLDCWQCMQHSITDNLAPNRVQHVCVQIRTDMNCVQQGTDTNCKLRTRLQEPGPQSAQFLSDKLFYLQKISTKKTEISLDMIDRCSACSVGPPHGST